jgi:predicted dehydrogenase
MNKQIGRRTFNKATLAATVGISALSAGRVLGANDRIRVAGIGVGQRGGSVIGAFSKQDGVDVVALSDVSKSTVAGVNQKVAGGKADTYGDFRKLLDRNDIDAVMVATPDHWHGIQTVAACNSGKDVYVEKPLSITVVEGRKMVEAARRNNRVVQVGLNRRSSPYYQQAVEYMKTGKLGKVTVSRAFRLSNMYPSGIGHAAPSAPPADLDWDMWLGPRPKREYQSTIAPYKFRWHNLYSSQMGNWGVHYLDVIRWLTDEVAPKSIAAIGGKFAVDDDRNIPDTAQAMFEFESGRLAIFGQYEASGNAALPKGEVELRGTQGTLYCRMNGYEVEPERGGQFQDRKKRAEAVKVDGKLGDTTAMHVANFLDCVKSRKTPLVDVEEGHRSTSFSLLANISLALGKRLEWDAVAEQITNCPEANDLLHYEYRGPWKLS